MNFVVSMRLGAWEQTEPETPDKVLRMLERYPGTKFKLDPTNNWTPSSWRIWSRRARSTRSISRASTRTPGGRGDRPRLYRMVIEAFPEAWLEDPDVTDETLPPSSR